ncbi:MAG TPA: RNA-binding transcriptional accessory protein [Candidatus Gemmiger stercorigallinarum]|nr:RNA-binding transcriptional accessory protein [Candidatus Gemmiger stercorigallinarum]
MSETTTPNPHISQLAQEFELAPRYVEGAVKLIDEGNTIPFIARYRKEATGSMDDQVLRRLGERLDYLRGLDARKEEVSRSITEQNAMTPELQASIAAAKTLAEVEDLYRPYKPKRKTRASIARARGLQPLADAVLRQNSGFDPAAEAAKYTNDEVPDAAAALAGAQDILAEQISDDARCRAELRRFYRAFGLVHSVKAKEEDSVYAQYYDYTEPVSKLPGHRILALDRGEREGFLKVSIQVESDRAAAIAAKLFVRRAGGPSAAIVEAAALDAYKRLIHPSLETELRGELSDKAAEGAIQVFGDNLRQLLMQPPIRGKVVMGLDPGYRMGCKVAVVDATGRVLDTGVVYPVPEFKKVDQAKAAVKRMIRQNHVEVLAIGNGTAGRETEQFAADVIRELAESDGLHLQYMVVSEAGASVYSASKLAAEEFPQFDVNLRSAVSIARRLQDPLAELVKIDPKAVGVGQYQHDMPQKRLNETLDGVVEDCVNSVGVDLNTASAPLLRRVAGITAATAKNIVARRETEGPFASRTELKKVKGLGPKAFEQCAGFLRLPGAKNKLDETAVHPESYPAAKALLQACGYKAADIGTPAMAELDARVAQLGAPGLCAQLGVGEPTLRDIVAELKKPGRDVRDSLPKPLLRSDVMGLEDLKEGMELTGTVRNVIDFGAFVDIGVHQDGLVHISQISDRFIKHPRDVLKVGDVVRVRVLSVDGKKKRIALTMKGVPQPGTV